MAADLLKQEMQYVQWKSHRSMSNNIC